MKGATTVWSYRPFPSKPSRNLQDPRRQRNRTLPMWDAVSLGLKVGLGVDPNKSHLPAEPVADDASLRKGCVLVKGVR